jgi:hypothetical protein
MTAAKKSDAAVRKSDRRRRERDQPRAASLRKLVPVIEKNIKQGLDISKLLRGPIVDQGKSKGKK